MKLTMKYIKLLTVVLAFAAVSCENSEDDYKKFGGDGPIRYIGKCQNFQIDRGWKRFRLNWENSVDPAIKNVKIVWTSQDVKDSVVLDKTITEYTTDRIFENKSYTFNIFSVDENGNGSIPLTVYGRPYTEEHEEVRIYGKLENKYFFVDNKLILVLDPSGVENVQNPVIEFFSNSSSVTLPLTAEHFTNKFLVVDDVDTDKDVTVSRTATIEGCFDPIDFAPYVLERNVRRFNSDFVDHLKQGYDVAEIDETFINSLTTLHINTSLISLEDILYFPNLERVVIGGKRYYHPSYIGDDYLMTLKNKEISLFALQKARELKSIELDIHNNHFTIADDLDFENALDNPVLPDFVYLDQSEWTITCSTDSDDRLSSNPQFILDKNPATNWSPGTDRTSVRKHELLIDMQTRQSINGFIFRQSLYAFSSFLATDFRIMISDDKSEWNELFEIPDRVVGSTNGEVSVHQLKAPRTCRYIKITINDQVTRYGNRVQFADFVMF